MLTYSLWQIWQDLAVSADSTRCVCLWRDRLELVAKFFPHSWQKYFCLVRFWCFDLPSVWYKDSTVKAFILDSGTEISEEQEVAGEEGGEGESARDNLEVVDKSRASSFGSVLNLLH